MKFGKRILATLMCALTACACGCAKPDEQAERLKNDTRGLTAAEYSIANLTAVDDYGRTVEIADPKSDDLYVGLFYFAWLGNHYGQMKGIYDVDKLEKENPDALYDPTNTTDSPAWQFHFTNEPLYGYYSMNDPWVITRHIELFTMAGLDYILFDYTNSVRYNDVARSVLETCRKFKDQGWKVPGVGFYTNSNSAEVVTELYNEFYSKPKYDDLWFRFKGDDRPVIVGVSTLNVGSTDQVDGAGKPLASAALDANGEIYKSFNFFESQWPSSSKRDEEKGLPWLQWGTPLPNDNGNASVSVAQHSGQSVFYSDQLMYSSRGFNGSEKEEDWRKGANFQWQWDTAMKFAERGMVKNIFVCGYNEWTAIKHPSKQYHTATNKWDGIPSGPSAYTGKEVWFVDGYNAEYSREVEPSKTYGDNFYLQMVRGLRNFKMKPASKYRMKTKTIADISDFGEWENVFVEYADFAGDAMARDGENAANKQHAYIDNSNRNDFKTIKVTHDSEHVYVYAETVDDVLLPADADKTNWLNLFISAGDTAKNFGGFNYVINRKPAKAALGEKVVTSVEKCGGGYSWTECGKAEYYASENKIVYKIPLVALGLSASDVSFSFKLADNVTEEDDILDYYVSGDCAPVGRFGYAYGK